MRYLCITVIAEKNIREKEQHFENELAGTLEDEIAVRSVFLFNFLRAINNKKFSRKCFLPLKMRYVEIIMAGGIMYIFNISSRRSI